MGTKFVNNISIFRSKSLDRYSNYKFCTLTLANKFFMKSGLTWESKRKDSFVCHGNKLYKLKFITETTNGGPISLQYISRKKTNHRL